MINEDETEEELTSKINDFLLFWSIFERISGFGTALLSYAEMNHFVGNKTKH